MIVHKYTMEEKSGKHTIPLPEGSVILSIQEKEMKPVLWFSFDNTENHMVVDYVIATILTGAHFNGDDVEYDYLNTYHIGPMVYHAFRILPMDG